MTLTIGSLFSGAGMLDEGVRSVVGGTVLWHAEHEPPSEKNPRPTQAAARVLAHRYPDVPNLGDVSAVDWSTVPRVNVMTGGFPCQDISPAGKRAGLQSGANRSGQWTYFAAAIDALRPQVVVIENVRGILSAQADSELEQREGLLGDRAGGPALRALGRVLGDLADIGYDARWCGLLAADVGAPHGRYRVFVVAWPAQDANGAAGGERRVAAPGQAQGGRSRADAGRSDRARAELHLGCCHQGHRDTSGHGVAFCDGRHHCTPAHTHGARFQGHGPVAVTAQLADAFGDRRATADAERGGCDGRAPVQRRGAVGRAAAAGDRADAAAHADGDGFARIRRELDERRHSDRRSGPDGAGHETERPVVADADAGQSTIAEGSDPEALVSAGTGTGTGASQGRDAAGAVQWGPYEPAIRRWEQLTRPAPSPTETGPKGGQRLSPRFTEWLQGWPDGWVTDVPGITRNNALKLCGNGVVPQQAAEACVRLGVPELLRELVAA